MENIITKDKTCCFTGHRKVNIDEYEMKQKIAIMLGKAMDAGYTHFICGGAIGFDMLVSEVILQYKAILNSITLEIAVPCNGQDKRYRDGNKIRYAFVRTYSDKVTILSQEYDKDCMRR